MARPTQLPDQASNAAALGQVHQPTALPPVPTGQPAAAPTGVTPDSHAIDAVNDHVVPLGVAPHLPDFFG
jgi:hypothetical protein